MQLLRVGVSVVCLLAVAGASAHAAAKPRQAVFKVTLTATLTKDWTYTQLGESSVPECTRTTRGVGHWKASFRTGSAGRIRAFAMGGGRVRFAGLVKALRGSATKWGSFTTLESGPPPCQRLSRSIRCGNERRAFRGGTAAVGNPRRGVLQLGSLRRADPIRFRSTCLDEPADIRSIRTDLPLATGPLDAADVFNRNIPRFFVTGDTEQVTTLEGDVDGSITERVRWKLVFTRLAR